MADKREDPRTTSAAVERRPENESGSVHLLFVTGDVARTMPLAGHSQFVVDGTTIDDACETLRSTGADCVLFDHPSEENTVLDTITAVREASPDVPCVVASRNAPSGFAEDALDAGATDVVHRTSAGSDALLARRIHTAVDAPSSDTDDTVRTPEEFHRIYRALETAQEGIALLDDDGEFIYVNQSYADLHDYDPEEMLGRSWTHKYAEHEVDRVQNDILPSLMEEGTWNGETEGLRGDGSTFLENHSLSTTADGGLVCTIRDITDERRREELVEYYRSVVEDVFAESQVGAIIRDSSGRIEWANRAVERYLGVEGAAVEGRKLDALIDEELADRLDDPETFRDRLHGAPDQSGVIGQGELHVEGRPGQSDTSLEHTSQTIESGQYAEGHLELFYDVTEQKRKEQELRETRERLEAAMTVGSVGTWDWDVATDEITGDAALADLFDLDPAATQSGMSIETFLGMIHGDDRERIADAIETTLETGEQYEQTYRVETDDGVRWLLARGEPEVDDDGEIVRFPGALTDITDRKRTEEQLSATAAKLERSNERLEQFAYAASHDLQEPLRMVSSYLRLVEQRYGDELDADGEEFIEFAVDGAERMREMINGLLRYSRVDTQGTSFEPTDFDVVLEEARANLEVSIAESDADVTADDLPEATADGTQVMKLFQNLLSNAIQYCGDDPPRIHVGVEERPRDYLFSVRDEGIGIDPDNADDVFQLFNRLHTDEEYEGTGIGLAVCQNIVERHGGEIWVESAPGEGSTFYFTLPDDPSDRMTTHPTANTATSNK